MSFIRKDHPKFMKKRQITIINTFRKHEKRVPKENKYNLYDKHSRELNIIKSRFNKTIINHEIDMVPTNVILYTMCLSKF